MNRYLMETPMLDYSNAQIRQLIEKKGWKEMGEFEASEIHLSFCAG